MDPAFLILGVLLIGVLGFGVWYMRNQTPVQVVTREVVKLETDPYRYHTYGSWNPYYSYRSWNPHLWRHRRFRP